MAARCQPRVGVQHILPCSGSPHHRQCPGEPSLTTGDKGQDSGQFLRFHLPQSPQRRAEVSLSLWSSERTRSGVPGARKENRTERLHLPEQRTLSSSLGCWGCLSTSGCCSLGGTPSLGQGLSGSSPSH